ncbi:hypothetical protein LCGC14_1294000 [marine sediment metagenome]|uniref:Uncharacterized protein n=1 Tax=marine sediment metagenome TaxID=412755 RepID=A0A0F9KRT2_9ZZZZ
MAEPVAVVNSPTIVQLLARLDLELLGFKGAFSEDQKVTRINKAKDEVWKVLKQLKEGYFMEESALTGGLDNEFAAMVVGTREYDLPKDLAELRLIEVTGPTGYEEWNFIKVGMNSPRWREARMASTVYGAGGTSQIDAGTILYDIVGPNASGRQRIVLASFPPVALELKLWYTRIVPDFTVPKAAAETLITFLAPYVGAILTYAVKSLLRLEDAGIAREWEREWLEDLRRTVSASSDRSEADIEVVEDFGAGQGDV